MGFRNRLLLSAAISVLIVASLLGQGTTGSLTGTVTQEGNPLPGVSVTISSPNMQGTRTSVTNAAGGFSFGALPPGDYTVRYELQGMQTATKRVTVGLAQSARADVEMRLSAVAEAITVTAAAPATAETTEVQTNLTGELIDQLPVARTPAAIASLAPGVLSGVNGPSISGGFSFDNLYTVNGAVIQENLRGQTHNLYIEDAIQETTIQTAGVSAEFGNFTGGVVNAITKSGGNEFSGSLRDSMLNANWTERSPDTFEIDPNNPNTTRRVVAPENPDELIQSYEATLGGRIIRDRLWFFTSGRFINLEAPRTFQGGGGRSFITTEEEKRMEGKLTASITSRHSIIASYLDAPLERANECQVTGCYDISAVDPSTSRPATFATFNYNGVISNNFLIEGSWSQKEFTFIGTGGEDPDRVTGTPFGVLRVGGYVNEPYFAGKTPEERDNMAYAAKATYYLGTRSFGSHNIIGGYQHWHEKRLSDNFQSPSDFVFRSSFFAPKIVNGQTLVSVKGGTANTTDFMIWFPIFQPSQGSDLNTDSLYFNDKWDLSSQWSFNLGLRYDKNDSKDSTGALVADDSKISPRMGASFDTFGNGRLRFNATYGHYVGRLAETITSAGSAAGTPATFATFYQGPDIIDVPSEEALRQIWAWFDSQGGFEAVTPFSVSIPGATSQIPESLVSPNVQEMTFGVSTQIGAGYLRLDYIDRDWRDFYESRRTLEIGRVTLPGNRVADLTLVGNTDNLERTYKGVTVQGGYRLFNRVNIGGNYTWSELKGNVSQESVGSVVVTETAGEFQPEYFNFAQNNPVGFLAGDQTHKIRAWATVDFPTILGNFNVSVLQNFDSGDPYSLSSSIDIRSSANFYGTGKPGGVANPGYVTAPSTVGYFFSERGEFRFDDVTSTNLALNYNTNPGWLAGVSFFAQAEMLNVFNEDTEVFNTSILTHRNNASSCGVNPNPANNCMARFNPMAGDVPQEGVHWRRDPRFGQPTGHTLPVISVTGLSSGGSFQIPRTYRFSVGLRF
jgi:hypothetical protein